MKFARTFGLLPLAMLVFAAGCDNPVEDDHDDHLETVVGVRISTAEGARIATYAAGEWTVTSGDAIALTAGQEVEWRIELVDTDGDVVDLHEDDEYVIDVASANTAVVSVEEREDRFFVTGAGEGATAVVVRLMHGGHPDFETNPGVPVVVSAATIS